MVLGGLVVGLVVAELVFRHRDDGAFPHLNLYVEDPALGVRLEPGATQKLAFGGNPVTRVRINGEGYRGGAWPAPGTDDVLVIGDSQVFGLGVEEDQTFSAELGRLLGRTVINGGVPTYGPAEYRAVTAELLAKRGAKTVVLTINLANDVFEVQRPNHERHAVWDGWAVRKESAPASVTRFPGRDWLYRRSHLFFALRKWRHADAPSDERGFRSEGTWHDAVTAGAQVVEQRRALDEQRRQRLQHLTDVQRKLANHENELNDIIRSILYDREGADVTVDIARAHPGDIVANHYAEAARPITATAREIAAAARARQRLRDELARWAKRDRGREAARARATLDARDQALAELTELDADKLQELLEPPLGAHIRDMKQLVEAAGARLVVVILPIDVQVSAEEWKKYGAEPIDMEPSKALATELVELCDAIGVSALDATRALAAVEPGAFLDRDIHMTPKGHAAVAAALAKLVAAPPPQRRRTLGERSPVPTPEAYAHVAEVIVKGSTAAGCETKQIREWLRVLCGPRDPDRDTSHPLGVEIERDDGGQAMALATARNVSLVIPVVPGHSFAARVTWSEHTRVLRVEWPAGAPKPIMAFDEPIAKRATRAELEAAAAQSPTEAAICVCWDELHGPGCAGAYGAPDAACVATYPAREQCPALLACIRRDPASPP